MPSNPMRQAFRQHQGRLVHKWVHYLDVYHRHFERFRGRPVTIVEFGVNQGGSLQLWQRYFGPQARIVGVDIDRRCAAFADVHDGGQVDVLLGDQEDRDFLRRVVEHAEGRGGPIDLVIEDGGHAMGQQIATFEVLYPAMADDGCYLTEDVHTSYWPNYGGGWRREGTFMEYAKGLTDQLNAWHSREPGFAPDEITRTTKSVHFYDSIVVIERGRRNPPVTRTRGERQFGMRVADLQPVQRQADGSYR